MVTRRQDGSVLSITATVIRSGTLPSEETASVVDSVFRDGTQWFVPHGLRLRAVSGRSHVFNRRTGICVEEIGDLVLDARNNLAVEESHHCGDEQRAEYDSDDDLDAFGDVEVTVFVYDCELCFFLDGLSLQVCFGGE